MLKRWLVAHRRARRLVTTRFFASSSSSSSSSTNAADAEAISKIRNVGIFAHVDGGKTTTTERILYYSGAVGAIGDVDDGDTVTDFLAQERARGITIQSASVGCEWNGHTVNIIDTPGHIDFTVEVERSLRVLDGAVAIIDAVAGVQAQTLSVWRQAQRHNVPRIAFVNKLDRAGASFERAVATLANRLSVTPVLVNIPIGEGEGFSGGLIDLVTLELVEWSERDGTGRTLRRLPLASSEADDAIAVLLAKCEELSPGGFGDADSTPLALRARAMTAREAMVETLGEFDDEVAETFLMGDLESEDGAMRDGAPHVDASLVWAALRRVVIAQGKDERGIDDDTAVPFCLPVLCGSALKNRGVQPLLDAMVALFPSPAESAPQIARCVQSGDVLAIDNVTSDAPLCALAFKTIHHPQRGAITFLRLYSGTIGAKTVLLNTTRSEAERPSRLIQIFAGDLQDVEAVHAGQIVGVVGLKHTRTGDTLVAAGAKGSGGGGGKKKKKTKKTKKNKRLAQQSSALADGNDGDVGNATTAARSRVDELVILDGVAAPAPVFIAALELEKASDEVPLRDALSQLLREDPSLHVTDDEENGQTLLAGMGELHLEIVLERLRSDFDIPIELSQMRVAYRESVAAEGIAAAAVGEATYEQQVGEKLHFAKVALRVWRTDGFSDIDVDSVSPDVEEDVLMAIAVGADGADGAIATPLPEALGSALCAGIDDALCYGPAYGYPLHAVSVELDPEGCAFSADTTPVAMQAAAMQAVTRALENAAPLLLEPAMAVEVEAPPGASPGVISSVISDLSAHRRATIESVRHPDFTSPGVVRAIVPVSEMVGYSTHFRSITHGEASFSARLHSYQATHGGPPE